MKRGEEIKYQLVYQPLRLISRLPLGLLYPLSDFASRILYGAVKYRRKVVTNNLHQVFPDASEEQIEKWSKEFYRHLCDTFIEAVKLLGINDNEVDRRITTSNAEIVDKAVKEGRSVILFLGHYGNWEWVPAIVRSFHNNAVMAQIYHPLRNKIFDRLMLKIRSRFGSESIKMANTYRRLAQIERENGRFVAGFISDQRPQGHHVDYWTEFMGIETDFIGGGEVIGDRMNCRYIYLDVEPQGRGHYKFSFKEIEPMNDGKEFPYTRRYLQLLEETIRRNPPYWLWSHKRFSNKKKKD